MPGELPPSLATASAAQNANTSGAVQAAKTVTVSLRFAAKNTTIGLIQRVLAAEVRLPGVSGFDLLDSERGLWGVGAVLVNRVASRRFPNTFEAVIKQKGQFAGFEDYPTVPSHIEKNISELERLGNSKGEKVKLYREHLDNILFVAQKVLRRDSLDIFVPAGGPYAPTLFFRTTGSSNPFGDGRGTRVPEYRGSAGGNDFYAERP